MPKYSPGDQVELRCWHMRQGGLTRDWVPGVVVQVDHRMAAIEIEVEVFSNTGWPIADRILWSAHGSPNLRAAAPRSTLNHPSEITNHPSKIP